MDHYRSYMDRIGLRPEEHRALMDRLKENTAPERRRTARRLLPAACMALYCLAALGVWRMWKLPVPNVPPEEEQAQVTDGPVVTAPGTEREEYVLSVPLSGDDQEQQMFCIFGVEYVETIRPDAQILYPQGWFEVELRGEEMAQLLAGPGAEEVPWSLFWGGYDLTGRAVYDGEGALWQLWLTGVSRSDSRNGFTLTVRPGDYPLTDMIAPDQTATEIGGVAVYGSKGGRYGWDDSGETGYVYEITMMSGDAGLNFQARQLEEEDAALLCTMAANTFAFSELYLEELADYQGAVPDWWSGSLTWQETLADEKFGDYVPAHVPGGFAFENAWREWGQGRDYLRLYWHGYYTGISIDIRDADTWENLTLTDPADRERYDVSLYSIPYADSVPEAYRQEFDNPVFAIEDVTPEVIAARMRYVDGDSGDVSGYRGNFAVYYAGENVLVRYSLDGITPQEAYELIAKKESAAP